MSEPTPTPPPRYLRFVTALLLGAAIAAPVAVVVMSGCSDEGDDADDEPPIDSRFDAAVVVDGPLPPPDLPRVA